MLGRRVAAGAVAAMVATLAPVGPARAAEPLVVPEDPRGVVSVAVDVPTADAPYVRIAVTSGGATALLPIQANAGPGTTIPVETWGAFGPTNFRLDGCTTEEPTSCTALATVARSVVQTDVVHTVWERPAAIFAFPESELFVTAHNDGGGVLELEVTGEAASPPQALQDGARTSVDLSGQPSGTIQAALRRCSAFDHDLCETVSSTGAGVVTEVPVAVDPIGPTHDFVSGSGRAGALGRYEVRQPAWRLDTYRPPFTTSWTLLDADGSRVVAGPVPQSGPATSNAARDVVVDAEKAAGHPIAPGDYLLRFTDTMSVNGTDKSGSADVPVTFVADAPAYQAPEPHDSSLYRDQLTDRPLASWTVPRVTTDYAAPATLVVKDASGREVLRRTTYAGCPAAAGCAPPWAGKLALSYELGWTGLGTCAPDGCPIVPAGVYTATAEILLPSGEVRTIRLGTVRLYDATSATRTVRVSAASARIAAGRVVGRCSAVRVPGPRHVAGSVGLLSRARCSSDLGRRDLVKQRFRVRVPAVSMIGPATVHLGVRMAAVHRSDRFDFHYSMPLPGISWREVRGRATRRPSEWAAADWEAEYPLSSAHGAHDIDLQLDLSHGQQVDVRDIEVTVSYRYYSLR